MLARSAHAVCAFSLLSLLGCGASDQPPESVSDPFAVEAIFGPASETELTPYPSNRYSVADSTTATGLRVNLSQDNTSDDLILSFPNTVTQLNAMDGFSTVGGVVVKFSGPIDATGMVAEEEGRTVTLGIMRDANEYKNADSPMFLVDVDPSSPERGQARGLVPKWYSQAKDDFYVQDEHTLVIQPAEPLREATRYAFVITKRLEAADGGAVVRSSGTNELLAKPPSDAYAEEVQSALDELEGAVGLTRDDVVVATAFTTATIRERIAGLGQARRAATAPTLTRGWELETTPSSSDTRGRFMGAFSAPEYRRSAPDGKWEPGSGAPAVQSAVDLEVSLTFSDATQSGPRTLVIYQHGLGGDKGESWGMTSRLHDIAPAGVAVLAIDSPGHGARSTKETNVLDSAFSFFGIDPATQDFDIGKARDNFRQMAADQLELIRLIATLSGLDVLPIGAPDGVPDLDTSQIFYFGHSFGSVQGATIAALAPEITHATWNVGGAGLMTLLRDSALFTLLVDTLTPAGVPRGAVARFFAVTQAVVDPGDPLNYARFVTLEPMPGVSSWVPRDVLLQQVMGDTIVPNSSGDALARACGLALLDPLEPISGLATIPAPATANLPTGGTGVISQFDRMDGDKRATHGELVGSPEGRQQYIEFFRSAREGGRASVPSPY